MVNKRLKLKYWIINHASHLPYLTFGRSFVKNSRIYMYIHQL